MAFTHTFQIKINGIDIEGELSFNGGVAPRVSIDSSIDLKLTEYKAIGGFLDRLHNLHDVYGVIDTIEILKKP